MKMKNMFFVFLISLALCENSNFCGVITMYDLISFNQYDVFEYWTLQQLLTRYGGNHSLAQKIGNLLMKWKLKISVLETDFRNISNKKYVKDKNSSIYNCWITFSHIKHSFLRESLFTFYIETDHRKPLYNTDSNMKPKYNYDIVAEHYFLPSPTHSYLSFDRAQDIRNCFYRNFDINIELRETRLKESLDKVMESTSKIIAAHSDKKKSLSRPKTLNSSNGWADPDDID